MTPTIDSTRARRYLLGEASEEESAVIEQEYFEREDAIDSIAAAEDDLIEEYLADQLSAAERNRFERTYLSSPTHRVRVETVRRLMAQGAHAHHAGLTKAPAASGRLAYYRPWLALAASLIVIASAGLWVFSSLNREPSKVATSVPPPAAPVAEGDRTPARQIFALAVSPVSVRGTSESLVAAIPAGTDIVEMRLESDGESRTLTPRRATVRTVGGRQVWQGPATPETNPSPGIVARIDVPAANIPADDYMISLYGTDRSGAEVEWAQYFLRVRAR